MTKEAVTSHMQHTVASNNKKNNSMFSRHTDKDWNKLPMDEVSLLLLAPSCTACHQTYQEITLFPFSSFLVYPPPPPQSYTFFFKRW